MSASPSSSSPGRSCRVSTGPTRMAEAADAVRYLESGKVRAKLAITVGPVR